MTTYYNECANPSFEVSLAGWTALAGTDLAQVDYNAYVGQYAMQVATTGAGYPGGVYGPSWTYTGPASLQIQLGQGAGSVLVQAVANPGGVVLAEQVVYLTTAWQNIKLENLTLTSGQSLYAVVQTIGAEDIVFLLDAVMYEPSATADPYFDGDSPGASWLGTPGLSASSGPGQTITLSGGAHLEGYVTTVDEGEVFTAVPYAGETVTTGTIDAAVVDPPGTFDDFAIWPSGDIDPALSYWTWNNAGVLSGKTDYSRPWGIVYPPLDYPVPSLGANLWNRAAFMAMGLEFVNVATGAAQNITWGQVEMVPLEGTGDQSATVAAYDPPRTVHLCVKPTRLNYCPNPSFEVSAAGWSGVGEGTVSQDGAKSAPFTEQYDGGSADPANSYSGKIVMHASGDGASIQLANLLTGFTYVASLYVQPGAGLADISLSAGSFTSASLSTSQGDLLTTKWYRPYVIFTASAPTVTLDLQGISGSDVSYPAYFWADLCLVEAGEVLGAYFDGGFTNPDYGWENGGTAGLTRSYYYEEYTVQSAAVSDILAQHLPLGITWAPPVYFMPPTQ